jgi:hypothetical protein
MLRALPKPNLNWRFEAFDARARTAKYPRGPSLAVFSFVKAPLPPTRLKSVTVAPALSTERTPPQNETDERPVRRTKIGSLYSW